MGLLDAKRFYVFGLGRSGVSVSLLLAEKGFDVVAFDDNESAADDVVREIRVSSREAVKRGMDDSDCLVVSPGVPLDNEIVLLAKEKGVAIAGELEIASRFIDSKIIAVTGTNGKSTTVGIIGGILSRSGHDVVVAGNIGRPLADVARGGSPEIMVLEVSSFQLDTIHDFRADVSVLLNVTPDHLDRYGSSFDAYARSKARINNGANEQTCYVYNAYDKVAAGLAIDYPGKTIAFSSEPVVSGVCMDGESIVIRRADGDEIVAQRNEFSPQGGHNLENALAAVAACVPLHVPADAARMALREYRPLPHRMELVRVIDGVAYVNDSKATNVDAAAKSLQGVEGKAVMILGGRDKDGDFTLLRPLCVGLRVAVLLGEASATIRSALEGYCEMVQAKDMDSAVSMAQDAAQPGDTVLLAPACASFDMFKNYEDRGEAFRRSVAKLGS